MPGPTTQAVSIHSNEVQGGIAATAKETWSVLSIVRHTMSAIFLLFSSSLLSVLSKTYKQDSKEQTTLKPYIGITPPHTGQLSSTVHGLLFLTYNSQHKCNYIFLQHKHRIIRRNGIIRK